MSSQPEWLHEQQFVDLLKRQFVDFARIINFNAVPALNDGENYLTIIWRVTLDIGLQDGSQRNVRYILKTPLIHDKGNDHEFHMLFESEAELYCKLVPELEQLYADYADLRVSFKPKHFEFPQPPKCDYILMEDLSVLGYRNLNRLTGLEQHEIEAVLKKLSQWHAASAKRVEVFGGGYEHYEKSYFAAEHRQQLEEMNAAFTKPFLDCLPTYGLIADQEQIIRNYESRITDLYIEFGRIDRNSFNVLNHGDFWCNNFMYSYKDDNIGKPAIDDVCFVDFQLPKYGTPAQDLFCLLMTSPKFAIKLHKFEHFIAFYHAELVKHLKLLSYAHALPTLTELHANLKQNSLWAYVCAQRQLPVVLLPPSADSSIENFMGSTPEGVAFKKRMLLSPSYVTQITAILPWLIERQYVT